MDTLVQDFRYGLRMLAKRPAITAIAVLSLGLGIGANTTIFTMIQAVFLSPIPVRDGSRLVQIFTEDVRGTGLQQLAFAPMSYRNFQDVRDQSQTLEGVTSFAGAGAALRVEGDEAAAQNVPAQIVTGNYFGLLGVEAAAGRLFAFDAAADEQLGAHPELVLSHGLWQRRFGGEPDVVGTTVLLNNQPFTVVGVAAEGFKGTQSVGNPDLVWVHVSMREQLLPPQFVQYFEERRPLIMAVIGRLRPDATHAQAQAELTAIAQRLAADFPDANGGRTATLVPFSPVNPNQQGQLAGAGRLMMVVVGLVLLIACANVANLLLARAVEREKEIALRVALGASRLRLVRQLLTESVLLALAGGGVGVLIAFWSRGLLWSLRPPFLPDGSIDLALNGPVLAFTFAIALTTGVLFGLVPSLQASNPELKSSLQEGGRRATSGTARPWLRAGLVVGEIALAIVTLIGAGLFIRSMQNAQRIDPGFEADHLLVGFLNTTQAGYDLHEAEQFFDSLVERTAGLGGVESVALSQNFPLGGGFLRSVFPEGVALDPDATVLTTTNPISPDYFRALGIGLLRGRAFNELDDDNGPWVAIVNPAMAERFWPGEEVLGRRFTFYGDPGDRHYQQPIEIIGVVEDTLLNFGQPPQAIVYMPHKQWFGPGWTLNVRTSGDPESVTVSIQSLLRQLDPNVPLNNLVPAADTIAQQLWAPRMGAGLLSIFGLLALALAMVGVYGVMRNNVDRRAHEMGIRMALGARRGAVIALVVRQGMLLVAIGLGAGLAAALALSRLVQSMLFDVPAADPVTFGLVALTLLAVALVAVYLPARRLTALDSAMALRVE